MKLQVLEKDIFGSEVISRYSRKNKKKIEEYIRNQLQEDIARHQLRLFEATDSI